MELADDPVRALHNQVAASESDSEASTRPAGTTAQSLDLMVADVLAKLDVGPTHSVIELGCGTGVLAVPLARASARFVGVDFAERALEVLGQRVDQLGLRPSVELVHADIFRLATDQVGPPASFDRVLVYATFHYVVDEAQARDLLASVVSLLKPGGKALIGSLPMPELAQATDSLRVGGLAGRLGAAARWLCTGDGTGLHPLRWRAEVLARQVRSGRSGGQVPGPAVAGLEPLDLTRARFERWLADLDVATEHQWVAPGAGVPFHLNRADLVITRGAGDTNAAVPPVRPEQVRVAGLRLTVPPGCRARLLSRPDDRAGVVRFLDASPDATLRHRPDFVEFVAAMNGNADLLVLERDGAAQCGIPITPFGGRTIDVGNSGVLFPPGEQESVQKRAVRTLASFLEANPSIGLRGTQSLQAPAYDHPDRTALLASLVEHEGLAGPSAWSRAIDFAPDGGVGAEAVEAELFRGYHTKLRSQIRQARRNGLTVTVHVVADEADAPAAYQDFVAVHDQSWERTGLRPHGVSYWLAMSAAVTRSGGHDVVVVARTEAGQPVAVASAHVYADRAVYLAGASVPAGLEARANPLSLHHAIAACRGLGVSRFEVGRFSARETDEKELAITRYKSQFGGHLVRLTTIATRVSPGERAAQEVFRLQRRARVLRGREHFYP